MKIGFTGTMSVGKTTLVNALRELPEFKNYEFRTERSKYLRDLGIPLNTDSTLKGQIIFMAERCSELFQPNIITDRTIIDVMAFTSLAETIPVTHNDLYESLASKLLNEYDYIFYISPDGVDIEDNGVRTTDPEYRDQVNYAIRDIITKYQGYIQNLIVLNGSVEERVEQVKQALNL
jgi:deoxyadenosine/deoxycytidine kinase